MYIKQKCFYSLSIFFQNFFSKKYKKMFRKEQFLFFFVLKILKPFFKQNVFNIRNIINFQQN